MKIKSVITIALSLATISLFIPDRAHADRSIKEWANSEAIITKTDGTKTTIDANSLIYCIRSNDRLDLNGGQSIDFEKMRSFEVLQADEVRAQVLITLLNGSTIRDSMDVSCSDIVGANSVGSFKVLFPNLKRVDFQRAILSNTPTAPVNTIPSRPVTKIPKGKLKPWKSSDAVITKTDGTIATVYANSLSQCITSVDYLTLAGGQRIDFENMQSFEVLQADEASAKLLITMLDGNIVKDSVDNICNDVFGANSAGRFTVNFPQLKRVDFQRYN
jgi:hypothetical protein